MISAITLIFIATLGFAIYVFALVFGGNAPSKRLRRRLEKITAPHLSAVPAADLAATSARRNVADSSIASLDKLIKRLMPRPAKLRERLAATGRNISLAEYLLTSLLVGAISFTGLRAGIHISAAATFLLATAVAVFIPHKAIGLMIVRRQRRFLAVFPEAIELMVRGLKSGIPVSESMKVVGRELPDPIGQEFRSITDALTLGQSFDEALAMASKRIELPEFRFFEISLGIQQETGGNLAETLENLAVILRKRKQMKLKVKALSSEARASAYIIGSLPFLMFIGLSFINPEQMALLFYDRRGNVILAMAVASLATGVGTMIKMGKLQV